MVGLSLVITMILLIASIITLLIKPAVCQRRILSDPCSSAGELASYITTYSYSYIASYTIVMHASMGQPHYGLAYVTNNITLTLLAIAYRCMVLTCPVAIGRRVICS